MTSIHEQHICKDISCILCKVFHHRSATQSQNLIEDKAKMSTILHKFFLSRMGENMKELEAKGGIVNWDNGFLMFAAPNTGLLAYFKNKTIYCLLEDTLQLSVDSWNKFMSLRPDGSSLFQQLIQPFHSNPNVEIHTDMATSEVILVGFKVAVQDTKQSIASEICKVIPVDG